MAPRNPNPGLNSPKTSISKYEIIHTHRIHGAGIYANIKGDIDGKCYHIWQHHGSYGIWSYVCPFDPMTHSQGHLLPIAFGMLLLGVECPNLKTTLSSLMRSTGFERRIRHGIFANSLRQTAAYPMQCASKVAKTGFGWPMTQSLPENFGSWSYLFWQRQTWQQRQRQALQQKNKRKNQKKKT